MGRGARAYRFCALTRTPLTYKLRAASPSDTVSSIISDIVLPGASTGRADGLAKNDAIDRYLYSGRYARKQG